MRKEILIVDGYNMIGAWPDLVALKQKDQLEMARDSLLKQLEKYQRVQYDRIIVVFDAQFVPGIQQVFKYDQIEVVFTEEGETADRYIEKIVPTYQSRFVQVVVATSDLAEQWLIFQKGALRQSAFELYQALRRAEKEVTQQVKEYKIKSFKRVRALNDYQVMLLKKFGEKLAKK